MPGLYRIVYKVNTATDGYYYELWVIESGNEEKSRVTLLRESYNTWGRTNYYQTYTELLQVGYYSLIVHFTGIM